MNILILNGPNLNLLGKRQPETYGHQAFLPYLDTLRAQYPNLQLTYQQYNGEGALIDSLHQHGYTAHGIVLNAGAYTHTSIAIADAIAAIPAPVIEVHISNIFAREPYRHHSYLAPHCIGSISGFGLQSYQLALAYFHTQTSQKET